MLLCWFSYICARACVRWVCGESKGTCQPACCWWSIQRGNWAGPSGKLATHHLRIHTRGGFHTVTNPLTSPLKLVESIICTSIPWYSFASMASLYNFLKTTKNKSKRMKRNFAIHLNSLLLVFCQVLLVLLPSMVVLKVIYLNATGWFRPIWEDFEDHKIWCWEWSEP